MDMTLKSRVKVKYSKNCHTANNKTQFWIIDGMCSYLAQQLLMMCRLKRWYKIADMTLWSKAKVTHT